MWVWDDMIGEWYWENVDGNPPNADDVYDYSSQNGGATVLEDGTVVLAPYVVEAEQPEYLTGTAVLTDFGEIDWGQWPQYPIELPPEDESGGGFFSGLFDFLKGIQIQPFNPGAQQPQPGSGQGQVVRAPTTAGGAGAFFNSPGGMILIAAGVGLGVYALSRRR